MLILGHAGITLGSAVILNGIFSGVSARQKKVNQAQALWRRPADWFASLAKRVDIRFLLLGSLLPDIIDKPAGQVLFRDTFSNGRIFSHTLVFFILISLAGIYLYRKRGKTWLLAGTFGVFTHLVFDQLWELPKTLFWPLYGFSFARVDLTGWTGSVFYALLHSPEVYVPEIIGGAILLVFGGTLWYHRGIVAFLRDGSVKGS